MKKIISLLLSVVMVLSLVACGGATSQAPAEVADAGAEASGKIKIGMVTDIGGVHDQSFNQSSWEGLVKLAEEDDSFDVKYLESKTDADYATNIDTFIDNDYDLVIGVGYMLADAISNAAETYPDRKFALIDEVIASPKPNVACLTFKQEQCSYLVGVVAAMMSKNNNIGYVQGMLGENQNKFGVGYVAGAKSVNPDIVVQQQVANSFADSAAGKALANKMFSDGADVIFHAAGGTGAGVISGCQENGIYAVGVDSDQSYIAPNTIITSAMKMVGVSAIEIAKEVKNGTFKGGEKVFSLENGGIDIAPTKTLLTQEVIDKVEQVKQDIKDGKIVVPSKKEECPDFTLG